VEADGRAPSETDSFERVAATEEPSVESAPQTILTLGLPRWPESVRLPGSSTPEPVDGKPDELPRGLFADAPIYQYTKIITMYLARVCRRSTVLPRKSPSRGANPLGE